MTHVVAVAVTGLWRSPEATTGRDAPLLAERPRLGEWLAAHGPDERRTLWGRLDSQLLLGEPVRVHEELGDWVRVTAPWQPYRGTAEGYPGFVRKAHLAPASAGPDGPSVVVTVPSTVIRSPADDTVLLDEVGYATVLPRAGDGVVRLPDGRTGRLAAAEVAPHRWGGPPPAATELLADAAQFLGSMYLAAGTHGLGYDCSGLVHAVYRRFGHRIPRDARDMIAVGVGLPTPQARPGDLLLFTEPATGRLYHVAFALELPRALHVSEADWACIDTPLTPARQAHLSHARRFNS